MENNKKSATIFIGRTQPPHPGHIKAIDAVMRHAEETGGTHYIFPTHTTGTESDPLDHDTKVSALRQMMPTANIVSDPEVRTPVQMMKYLQNMGHTHITILGGGDEDQNKWKFLQSDKYRKEEYPKIKQITLGSAGERKEGAEDVTGHSGTMFRELIKKGDRQGFVSKYPKQHRAVAKILFDKASAALKEIMNKKKKLKESAPVAIFLIGGPGSGKDFVLKNTFAKYDLMEVQIDHVLNGSANKLFEEKKNIVINGPIDESKINEVKYLHENYTFDNIYVSVTNKVSRIRNEQRENPLNESKRIEKFLSVEKLVESLDNVFVFNNSMNVNNASAFEKLIFEDQTAKLEQRIEGHGIVHSQTGELQTFTVISERFKRRVARDKESGLPKKYVAGLSSETAKARAAHWKEKSKLSDSDPRAYEPAPGDAESKTTPSKHTLAVRKAMAEGIDFNAPIPPRIDPRRNRKARGGNITAVMQKRSLIKRMQQMSESVNNEVNLKHLIDTTKSISNMLSIPPNKLANLSENRAVYIDNNILWEVVKHPSSQRWYLTGNYENSNE